MTKEFQSQKKLFKTEKVLYQNLEILPAIFELSPDAVALTRVSDGKFIYFNQEYLKQIGYSSDELKNHTTQELNLYADSNRQEYIDSLKRDKIVTNFELKVKRKDGSFIDVLYSARYINVDGEEVLLNIGKDITEHKKAEQQIKNDANLMDQLYDAVI
ncbi:PAS domain S-box protein, partial [Methanobacterium sp.]